MFLILISSYYAGIGAYRVGNRTLVMVLVLISSYGACSGINKINKKHEGRKGMGRKKRKHTCLFSHSEGTKISIHNSKTMFQ